MGKARGKYTREKIKARKARRVERQAHIRAVESGEVTEDLPEPIFPEIFEDIRETYWKVLKQVPDPRDRAKSVYPLYLVLHRVVAGFLSGNRHIGVLFPVKRRAIESGRKRLGGLPTRKPAYTLLRRIDWNEANAILSPLWERLGYTPDLIVRRSLRNPREILDGFRTEQEEETQNRRKRLAEENEREERSRGTGAAKAKRKSVKRRESPDTLFKASRIGTERKSPTLPEPVEVYHDLVVDGKVVKASYNSGVKERFVHVTEIKSDRNDNRSRFVIGVRPTELDRNGEWGAAASILDALLPLPDDTVVLVSGDAGFCVGEFCEWLTKKGFFLYLSDKGKRR